MEEKERLKEDLLKISGLMLAYAEDCDWGDDACKDCQFSFFCEDGYNPLRIADVLQNAVKVVMQE